MTDRLDIRNLLLDEGFDAYVFFTLSGKEEELAQELGANYADAYFLVLKRMVHRSDHGRKWDEEDVLIKGYVFVYLKKGHDIKELKSAGHFFKVLGSKTDGGRLFGRDYDYAKWVLEQDGLIGISKAIRVNEKIRIVSGPLAELEGYIVDYSKRNRNCCVELDFMNQKIRTWLPFEWTDQNYMMDD